MTGKSLTSSAPGKGKAVPTSLGERQQELALALDSMMAASARDNCCCQPRATSRSLLFISFSDCVGAFFLFLWLLLSANTIYSSTAPQFPCFTCLFVMLARRLIYSLALNCKSPWRARPERNPSNSERTRDSRKRKEKEKRKTQKKICRDQPCPSVFSKMNKTS